jgi:putative exosortase-associated protein (TIGR04073 family)
LCRTDLKTLWELSQVESQEAENIKDGGIFVRKVPYRILVVLPVLWLLLLTVSAPSAYADDPFVKIVRGGVNVVTCWGEYPVRILDATEKHGNMVGIFEGLVKGTWFMGWRAVAGVYDMATFLIPLPTRYRSIIEPDNVLGAITGTDVAIPA